MLPTLWGMAAVCSRLNELFVTGKPSSPKAGIKARARGKVDAQVYLAMNSIHPWVKESGTSIKREIAQTAKSCNAKTVQAASHK